MKVFKLSQIKQIIDKHYVFQIYFTSDEKNEAPEIKRNPENLESG